MSATPSLIVITPAIAIDRAQQIVLRYQRPVFLPARTWHLLAYLVDHPHRLIPDATLLRVGWPQEDWHTPSESLQYAQGCNISNGVVTINNVDLDSSYSTDPSSNPTQA